MKQIKVESMVSPQDHCTQVSPRSDVRLGQGKQETSAKSEVVQRASRKKRIGYVLRRFPSLSETFVLNEILGIEALRTKVEIFSIMQPRDPKYHEGITRLKSNIRYVPTLDDLKSLFKYNRRAYKSFGRRYIKVFALCVLTFKPMQIWRFLQAGYIAERAREKRLEHLHAHFANRAANVAGLVHQISGIPYSFTAHAVDIYKNTVKPRILRKRMSNAEFVVTVSNVNKHFLEELSPESKDKIVVVYNGIDLKRFRHVDRSSKEPFTILCVGRMVEKKGLEYLIEACADLKSQGFDFKCNIIGKGKLRPKLNSMIAELDLKDQVKLAGVVTQDKIAQWFNEADAFVLPCIIAQDGNREGLPVSISEALASGLPVITTDVAGITEAVSHGENGLIVPERDTQAISTAIRELIIDPAFRERMAANARSSVGRKFDQTHTTRALNRMLTRGLNSKADVQGVATSGAIANEGVPELH